jgi:DNA-binding CsgD family transcriptional regulator
MQVGVIGRDGELGTVAAFLDGGHGFAALLIEGEAGIGKTAVWQTAIERAAESGVVVLAELAARAEVGLPFAALGDLLEPVLPTVGSQLAGPQRRAIEVALLRDDPGETPVDARAVGVATLSALRLLAADRMVLLALDDVQWMDAPSAEALAFALRRLRDERVRLLATLRGPEAPPTALSAVLDHAALLSLGPLSVGALHRIIREQLGVTLRRPALIRIVDAAGGNPLHALELARAERLDEQPARPTGGELDALLRIRLQRLPAETQDALLSVAVLGRPTRDVVARLHPPEALKLALVEGVLVERPDGRLALAHPLLAASLTGQVEEERRRERDLLVATVLDGAERALHLALGSTGSDERVAGELARAALDARRRGAPAQAAELLDHAVRLTPPDDLDALVRRQIDAAVALFAAGDSDAAAERLDQLVARLDSGGPRTEAMRELAVILSEIGQDDRAQTLLDQALADCPAEADALRARILRDLAWHGTFVARIADAVRNGDAAVEAAERIGDPSLIVNALAAASHARFVAGIPAATPDPLDRAIELERSIGGASRLGEGPRAVRVYEQIVSLELDGARQLGDELREAAAMRGDIEAEAAATYYLSRIALHAGELDAAELLTAGLRELSEQWGAYGSEVALTGAMLAALRGPGDEARSLVANEIAAGASGTHLGRLLAVLGALALSEGLAADAVEPLRRCERIACETGAEEPGATRFRPDLVVALTGLGELDEAETVLARFESAARRLERRWALAVAGRSRGVLAASRGEPDTALDLLAQALAAIEPLGVPLERARTLLELGVVARRARQRARARAALEQARDGFEHMGAVLWADRARAELARIGGRSRSGELTVTERRVAELVASGLSNREAAAELVVSVRTIETNLTRIYDKLGIRSRAQLVLRIASEREQRQSG